MNMEALATARPSVVVADDDDDIRVTICEILEAEGFHALPARNGSEALTLALSYPDALLLLDHRMPEITGADVVVELRETGHDSTAILMTADHHVRDIAAAAGIEHFITKPFAVRSLLELIGRALG